MSNEFINFIQHKDGSITLPVSLAWTIANAPDIEKALKKLSLSKSKKITIDGENLEAIDTSGAWMLVSFVRSLMQDETEIELTSFKKPHAKIIEIVEHIEHPDSITCAYCGPVTGFFKNLGESTFSITRGISSLVAFFGQLCAAFGSVLIRPGRLRFKSLVYHINEVGIKAVPIVALMAFLISIVLGYQGATQLEQFGATIFTIDLVAISVLREMGVLITAIMVAGRSGSAFAAQIGVMQVNEEVDAMRTIGLDPFEMLVLPRVLAILIVLPMLTLIADVVGLFGTLFVSSTLLDISVLQFLERLQGAVNVNTFLVGLVKAPIFAILIGMVGCSQGMQVRGSAAEVGARTTTAVVQSIFLVILADAVFSIIFTMLEI